MSVKTLSNGLKLICDHVGFAEMNGTISDKQLSSLAESALVSAGMDQSAASKFSGVSFVGKFQEADAKNKNGRIYPRSVLESSVGPIIESVNARSLMGELDHPETPVINIKNASHVVTKLYWKGNSLWGEGETLPTPWGLVLERLLRNGVRVGISSRGVGDGIAREGIFYISPGFRMITWDSVADPSTLGSYISAISKESINNFQLPEPISHKKSIDIDVAESKNTAQQIALYLRERLKKG